MQTLATGLVLDMVAAQAVDSHAAVKSVCSTLTQTRAIANKQRACKLALRLSWVSMASRWLQKELC